MVLVTFVTNRHHYYITFAADEQQHTNTQLSLEYPYHEMSTLPPWAYVYRQ